MPGLDGTGPRGMGPMTGGARGMCNPYGPQNYGGMPYGYGGAMPYGYGGAMPGFGMGMGYGRGMGMGGRGRGMGMGMGRRWYQIDPSLVWDAAAGARPAKSGRTSPGPAAALSV